MVEEEGRVEELQNYIRRLLLNKNLNKAMDITACVVRLVSACVVIVIMIIMAVKFLSKGEMDATVRKILIGVFSIIITANLAFLLKCIFETLYNVKNIKNMDMTMSNLGIDELIEKEKKLRRNALVCDLFAQLSQFIFVGLIGMMFILGPIYMAVTNTSEDKGGTIAMVIIMPLMGICAILFFLIPIIQTVKELRNLKKPEISYEYYIEKEPRFNFEKIKNAAGGLVFVVLGIIVFIEGIVKIGNSDAGQAIGMMTLGAILIGIGSLVSWLFSKGK